MMSRKSDVATKGSRLYYWEGDWHRSLVGIPKYLPSHYDLQSDEGNLMHSLAVFVETYSDHYVAAMPLISMLEKFITDEKFTLVYLGRGGGFWIDFTNLGYRISLQHAILLLLKVEISKFGLWRRLRDESVVDICKNFSSMSLRPDIYPDPSSIEIQKYTDAPNDITCVQCNTADKKKEMSENAGYNFCPCCGNKI